MAEITTANHQLRNSLHMMVLEGQIGEKEVLIDLLLTSEAARERFLKARQYDVAKTIEFFLEARQYRIVHQLDEILTKPVPKLEVIRANHVSGWHKRDKLGNPVYIDLLGQLNLEGLKKSVTMEDMVFAHHHGNEYLTRVIHRLDDLKTPAVGKIVSIIDLKGMGRSHLSKMIVDFMGATSKADQLLFPEMLRVCVILNAGWIFSLAWKLIKPFLEERTQKKIIVCNDNGLDVLTRYIDIQDIPKPLGGQCSCEGNDCINGSEFIQHYLRFIKEATTSTTSSETSVKSTV